MKIHLLKLLAVCGFMLLSNSLYAALTYTNSPYTGYVGIAVNVTTTGAQAGYAYAVTAPAGGLPAGLTINAGTGAITGTPTATTAGAVTYTVTGTRNRNPTTTNFVTITIDPAFSISYTSPAAYPINTPITSLAPNVAVGWTIASITSVTPALPTGLVISGTGVISGTPTVASTATVYTIIAKNTLNGSSATATVTLTVNPPAPTLTYATGNVYTVGMFVSLTPTYGGGYMPTSCTIAPALPAGLSISPTGVISGTPTVASASNTYTVTATDAGGSAPSNSFTITINNPPPPIITYPTPQTYLAGTAIAPIGPTNTGGAVVTYSATLPPGLSIDPLLGTISGTPTVASPATDYVVTATNAGGSGTFPVNITVTLPLAPVFTYNTPDVFVVGAAITAQNPTNTGGLVNSYTISPALPAGLGIDPVTGIISGTPTAVAAATDYVVTGTNPGGSGTFTVNITVNPKLPALTYTSPDVYTMGVAITPLNPNNTGGAVDSYAVSPALPAGLSIDPVSGIISGTPTGTATLAVYVITATNVTGNGTFNITITVNPPKPIITYSSPQTYMVGMAITTLSASNTGGPIVSFSVAPTLPAGLTLNTSTGDITGTPTIQSVATNYVVTATNAGGTGTFTISITVHPMPPALTYTTPPAIVYGNAIATLTPANAGGVPTGCTISPTGTGLVVSATGVITGTPNAAGSTLYTITATNLGGTTMSTVTITVNQKALTVTGSTVTTKVYDGTTTATIAGGTLVGKVGTDVVTLVPSGTFATPNVGTGIAVTSTSTLTGAQAANYILTEPTGLTGKITAKNLTITGLTANNKVYDGTTAATFSAGTLNGVIGSDVVTLTTTGTFANKNIGAGKAVTSTSTLGGAQAGNYTVTQITGLTATITAKALTLSTLTANNKTYDGTTAVTYTTGALVGVISPDVVTFTVAGAFATANAGTGIAVSSTITLGGAGAGNYTITQVTGLTANISPAPLTITANSQSRDYGIVTALTITYAGFVNGETAANLTPQPTISTTATATSPVSPPTYPITVSGAVDANYAITYVAGTLTITAPGTNTYVWDWAGGVSTAWETPQNWYINGIQQTGSYPGANTNTDQVQEEVNINFATANSPVLSTTLAINTILFGSKNNANLTVNSGVTLTTTGDITLQADNAIFSNSLTAGLTGNGTINTVNLNIINNQTALSGETTSINSSINALNVAGSISLTTTVGFLADINSKFLLTAGTTTVAGTLTTSNNPGFIAVVASTFAITPTTTATLVLTNAAALNLDNNPLTNIDGSAANVLTFNNTGATVQYSGTGPQTIYTDAAVSGLAAGPSYANLVIGGTGAKTLNGGNLNIAGNFTNSLTNDATNYVTLTNNQVNFNGVTATPQTLMGGIGNGTSFNNVAFTGAAVKTMSSGSFSVISAGTLNMGTTTVLSTLTVGASGTLTLNSDAGSSATVGVIHGKITGNVNVQRYVTGNNNSVFRCYRLFSSPVNASSNLAGSGYVDLSYLNNPVGGLNAITTAGPGGSANGFTTANTNPLIYLYDVTRATNNRVFVGGKDVGVTAITGSPNYYLSLSVAAGVNVSTTAQLPVGNSWLLYYVGSTSSPNITVGTRPTPDNATATAIGTLNQGSVTVAFWKYTGAGSSTIPHNATDPAATAGLNQVGNPYASTIDLQHVFSDNSTRITSTFYELDDQQGTYVSYVSGATSSTRASRYIVSGQGFLISGIAGQTAFYFSEADKVPYPTPFSYSTTVASGGQGTLLMDMPTNNPSVSSSSPDIIAAASLPSPQTTASAAVKDTATLVGLHLQLAMDSTANTQTGIYFSSKWSDTYNVNEDALDLDGTSPKVWFSSYSSDNQRLCVNGLSNYTNGGKRIRLYAGANNSGSFSISLVDIHNVDTNTYNVYLVDNLLKDSLDMIKYKSYAFTINNSDTTTYGAYRFVLAIERKPIPTYALISFSGQKVSNGVQLTWKTLNEGTYTGFALQKLTGNTNYNSIYTTKGTGAGLYSYVDTHPKNGNNTYRLQQTDFYGNITYSSPVTINYNSRAPNGSLTIYPNPSRTFINISLNTNDPGIQNYVADIYNISGTVMDHKIINSNTWVQDITSYKLGVYVIEIKTNTGYLVGQSKFVKIN